MAISPPGPDQEDAMPTTKIFNGTEWIDLQGPQGPEGPTVVSADAGNVARLGTDGKVLVAQADLNAKYVEVAGDTMTGPLAVTAGATMTAPATAISAATVLHVVREGGSAFIETYDAGANGTTGILFRRKAGTLAAPTPLVTNQNIGVLRWQVKPNNGAGDRTAAQINFETRSPETEDGYFDNALGISTSGHAAGKSSAGITLSSTAATGATFVVTAENFFVTADGSFTASKGNFVVSADGSFTASKGNFVVGVSQAKHTVTAGNGVTAVGLYGVGVGTSATSGGVTGLRGEVTGTVSTGTGVSAFVTATATQNFGLSSVVSGGTRNCGLYVDVPKAAGSYAVQFQGDADSYFKSNVGIGWSTPSVALEVGGATKLRTTLEVVGNITSAGTAHNFAAKSIPASAINGLTSGATAANDLTDVTVSAPAVGQVLRFDGTNFVNTKLNFSDLSGTIVNPTINAPSIFKVIELAAGSPEPNRACVIPAAPPVTSATITGVQGYWFSGGVNTSPTAALILGKVNTVTKVFTGGIATYASWVSLALGADEKHACVFGAPFASTIDNNLYYIRFYTPSENSNWSTGVRGSLN